MADPFIAEIRPFGFNFAPMGWAQCNGQLMPKSQSDALFQLLGNTYGGDGTTNFGLPNLQGNAALNYGQGPGLASHDLGSSGGEPTVTLQVAQMPVHSHSLIGSNRAADDNDAHGAYWAVKGNMYTTAAVPALTMDPNMLDTFGSGQPHNNLMPYLVVNFCIALQGVFPPRG